MPNLLVRDLDEATVRALKGRAVRQRRSLRQELKAVLQAAAQEPLPLTALEVVDRIRERLSASGQDFGDSVVDIRADRER